MAQAENGSGEVVKMQEVAALLSEPELRREFNGYLEPWGLMVIEAPWLRQSNAALTTPLQPALAEDERLAREAIIQERWATFVLRVSERYRGTAQILAGLGSAQLTRAGVLLLPIGEAFHVSVIAAQSKVLGPIASEVFGFEIVVRGKLTTKQRREDTSGDSENTILREIADEYL